MPKNIETTVDGDTTRVQPTTAEALTSAIRALLDAADRPDEVQTSTDHPGLLSLIVPTDLARRAGMIDGEGHQAEENDTARREAEEAEQRLAAEEAERQRQIAEDQKATDADAEAEAALARAAAESNAEQATPAPVAEELTPAQKAARTRKANEAAADLAAKRAADGASN